MYKIKVKNILIILVVSSFNEVSVPIYAGNFLTIKTIIENSYNQFGQLIGKNYSIDELEYCLKTLDFTYQVLINDVTPALFYDTV